MLPSEIPNVIWNPIIDPANAMSPVSGPLPYFIPIVVQ